jgi:hypothetical protein
MSHKPVRPSRPPKRGLKSLKSQVKAVNSLLTPFYSVIDADSAEPGRYAPRESLRYAIVPDLQPEPKAVAFTCSDELAFKIANFLSAEHAKNNPPCAGCAAFGEPTWEMDGIKGRTGDAGWYHYTAGIHPFKERYIWCAAKNASSDYPLSPEKADVKQAPITMDKEQVEFQLKCVAGRILTLVDAMVTSEAQNKAFKTYVKKEFREQFNRVFQAFHNPGGGESLPEELAVANEAF